MFLIGIFGIIAIIYMAVKGLWSLIPWLILAVIVTSVIGFILDHFVLVAFVAAALVFFYFVGSREERKEKDRALQSESETDKHDDLSSENAQISTPTRNEEYIQPIDEYPEEHTSNNANVTMPIEKPYVSPDNHRKVKVVGVTFTNAEQMLRNVVKDEGGIWNVGGKSQHKLDLYLISEPENEYDPNAIGVYSKYETPARARVERSGRVGYLPKDIGLKIDGEIKVKATVTEGYGHFGITVDLSKLDF